MESTSQELGSMSELCVKLLVNLDEHIFFNELTHGVMDVVGVTRAMAYLVREENQTVMMANTSVKMLSQEPVDDAVAKQVIRTKRAYISNHVERDPLFSGQGRKGIDREMAIPVVVDGVMIATIHLQNKESDFSREDITRVLDLLNSLQLPLKNIKTLMMAKELSQSLDVKLKEREREFKRGDMDFVVMNGMVVDEKEILTQSKEMIDVLTVADKAARGDTTILLEGPSGSGKELLARRIHCRSLRKSGPFIVLDASAFTEPQLELELFGGISPSGSARVGSMELANTGTLLVKNINKCTPAIQLKLLNALKNKMIKKIGSINPSRIDIRMIATVSSSLEEKVKEGTFREDLYYSLQSPIIRVPALKRRQEDIEILANNFLNKGKGIGSLKTLSPGAVLALREYSWPGNIRELQNIIERASIMSDGMIIEKDHLADSVKNARTIVEEPVKKEAFSDMTLGELEKKHIILALEHLGGNKTRTAKVLGITVKTLYNKLHAYGLIETSAS